MENAKARCKELSKQMREIESLGEISKEDADRFQLLADERWSILTRDIAEDEIGKARDSIESLLLGVGCAPVANMMDAEFSRSNGKNTAFQKQKSELRRKHPGGMWLYDMINEEIESAACV